MGTTTLGYPYPDAADAVAGLAAKVQALAQYVDDEVGLVKRGTETINMVSTATDYAAAVVFSGTAFPGTPTIVATISNKANPGSYEPVTISAKSSAGFTINVRRSAATASTDVDWVAVYK